MFEIRRNNRKIFSKENKEANIFEKVDIYAPSPWTPWTYSRGNITYFDIQTWGTGYISFLKNKGKIKFVCRRTL